MSIPNIPVPPPMADKLRRQVDDMATYATVMTSKFEELCDEVQKAPGDEPGEHVAVQIINELLAAGHREQMHDISAHLQTVSQSLQIEQLTLSDAITAATELAKVDRKIADMQAIFPRLIQRINDYKSRN